MSDVHEVLVRARNLLEQRGWCQGALEDLNGRVCARGAVAAAIDGDAQKIISEAGAALFWEVDRTLEQVVPDTYGPGSVVMFNNATGRTKEEVLGAFDKAIAATAPPPADPFPEAPTFDLRTGEMVS